jgi:uncharacterized membrane protein YqgA involved in biofilm formation
MLGTLVNTATVLAGSLAGLLVRRLARTDAGAASPSPRWQAISGLVMQGVGLFTIGLGIKMTLDSRQPLVVLLSIVLGAALGQLLGIEEALERLAVRLKQLSASSESTFVLGFVSASVLFCAGPMTILGSVQDGLQHDPNLLLIKSVMDGVSAVVLASTLGLGVIFSAVTVLVFQGLLTLLAARLQFLGAAPYLAEFTAAGGIIILAIGIRLLGLKDLKAGNLLPALALVVLFVFLAVRLHLIG